MSTKKKAAEDQKAAHAVAVAADLEGKVCGVLVASVKHELVDADLTKRGLPKTGTLAERIARLAVYYRENTPAADLGDCSQCKGDSNVDEAVCPACPFCGEGGVSDAPKAPATAAAPVATPAPATGKPEAKEPKDTAKEPPKEKAPKGIPKGEGTVVEKKTASADLTAAPIAGQLYTVTDLDQALVEVENATRAGMLCYWDLGKAIHRIFADKLYLQRREGGLPDGKPLYATWGAFAEAELEMSGGNAFRIMDVAVDYDRDTAVKFGVARLNAALRVEDKGERAKLLTGAEKVPVAEFEAVVAEYVKKKQGGKATPRGRLTPAQQARNVKGTAKMAANAKPPPAGPAAPVGAEKITAALALGKTKVLLFVKGSKSGEEDAKRAKRLADGPVGFEETANGVRMTYSVSADAKGALVLVIERKRV